MMFSAHNISFRYTDDTPFIFENINLSLAPQEILVIIGESGAGKSSLLHILGGFFPCTEGYLSFDNQKLPSPLTQLVAGFQHIKLVTQDTKLLPNHTILENIIFPIRNLSKENQQKRVENLLQIFDLENLQNRLPRQISGGQRQRATIAQALANAPDVLLLDEPFSHLDNENRIILSNILRKISAQGTSIIFVTHQAQEALALGDKIAVLAKKKIIQIDTPKNIYQRPISEKVAHLLGNVVFFYWENQKRAIRPENIHFFWENNPILGNPPKNTLKGIVKNIYFVGICYEIDIFLVEQNIDIKSLFFGKIIPVIGQEISVYFDESDFLW